MSTPHARHHKPQTEHAKRKKSRVGKELLKQARRRVVTRQITKGGSKVASKLF